MKNLVLIPILLLMSLSVKATEPILEQKYVYAHSGLKLRAQPNLSSKILKVIPYGDKVSVQKLLDDSLRIEWMSGSWVEVMHEGEVGYVFDGFISDLPLPKWEFELTQNDLDLTYPVISWAEHNYDEVKRPDTFSNDEMNKVTQFLEQKIRLSRKDNLYEFTVALDLPDRKIEDVYLLLKSMLKTQAERILYANNSLFVDNNDGEIHRIKINLDNPVEIRKLDDKVKVIIRSFHSGCDVF